MLTSRNLDCTTSGKVETAVQQKYPVFAFWRVLTLDSDHLRAVVRTKHVPGG